jgi:protein-S-isoprenylcysteine O-methyltransferase Ste14
VFLGEPAATVAGIAAFWTLFAAWVLGELWMQWRRRLPAGATSRDRGSMAVLVTLVWGGVLLGLAAAILVPGAGIRAGSGALFDAGLALMLGGLLLRWYAVAVLGTAFTVTVGTRAEQHVVARGPYRWVRHPSYAGSLLTILGVLLCATNVVALLAFALPLAGYAYRISIEERALVEGLGDRYSEYMRRTRRLIPFVL